MLRPVSLLFLFILTVGLGQLPNDPGELLEVRVVEGGAALLPCDVKAPTPGDHPILVLFYSGVTGMPIYSIDARSEFTDRSGHWSELGSRATFDLASHPPGLVLSRVTSSDSGRYRCRVDFGASPTRNIGVSLVVVEPPTKLVILGLSGMAVSGVIGPFPLGAPLTLACRVFGGRPRPRVTWWHEGSLLDEVVEEIKEEGGGRRRTNQVTNTLTLPHLTRQHLHRDLTCRATTTPDNLTTPLTASVTLDMTFPPLDVTMKGRHTELIEGVDHPLGCEARGSLPPAQLTWWLNGDLVTSNETKEVHEGNMSRSTFLLVPGRSLDEALLTCRAENPAFSASSAVEDFRRLQVYYAPQLEVRVGRRLDLGNIKQGEDVYFECLIHANPSASRVTWFLDGQRLDPDVSRGVIQSNHSLVLQGVGRGASGDYHCAATNPQGAARSPSLTLQVKFAPVCLAGQKWVYGSSLAHPVNVSCRVEAYPPALEFRWVFNTSTEYAHLSGDLVTSLGEEGSSLVTYTPQTHHDFGSLLCWAKNEVERQMRPCVFHVVPAGVPEPVENCSAWEGGGGEAGRVVVWCLAGWGGGLDQTFTLEVRQGWKTEGATEKGRRILAELRDQPEPHFTVAGLRAGQEYELSIMATNTQGAAPPTLLLHHTPIDVAEQRTSPVVAPAWPP